MEILTCPDCGAQLGYWDYQEIENNPDKVEVEMMLLEEQHRMECLGEEE